MSKKPKDSAQTVAVQTTEAAVSPAPKTPQDKRPRLTTSQVAQLKTLYLVKDWKPKEIAEKLGITADGVSRWIYRLELTKQKEKIRERVEAKALTKAVTEAEQALERWSPQIEELGDDTLDLARKEVANPSKFTAKSLQAYSGAMRNWSAMVREFNGLKSNGDSNPAQVNIFVGALQRAEAKPVDPAVDV